MKFLGAGSAFCLENFQSNMLIEKNGKNLLVDCGGDIRFSLGWDLLENNKDTITFKKNGLSSVNIDAIYISHLHADHIGGLEYMGFTTYFNPNKNPIKLFGETRLLDDLWDMALKAGLKSIQGKRVELEDYFDVHNVQVNGEFEWEGTVFKIVQVCHVVDDRAIVSSYGLMFKGDKGKTVFITTDTQYNPHQIKTFYDQADIIFQDCETAPFMSGVHAHYNEQSAGDPKQTKKKKHLYHYQDGTKPDCKKDGFAGWCEQGQVFEL